LLSAEIPAIDSLGVGVVSLVTQRMLDAHAIKLNVRTAFAVVRPTDLAGIGARDVESFISSKAGCQRYEIVEVLHTAREDVQQIGRDHGLFAGIAGVDERRLARHRDRFGERTDLQLCVHGSSKSGRQLDAVTPEGVEPRKREGDDISPRTQIDDVVAALAVCDDCADLLDQSRTGGFDRDAREHRSRSVFDDSRNAAGRGLLSRGNPWKKQRTHDDTQPHSYDIRSSHVSPFWQLVATDAIAETVCRAVGSLRCQRWHLVARQRVGLRIVWNWMAFTIHGAHDTINLVQRKDPIRRSRSKSLKARREGRKAHPYD
jgi:hypothetical protein